MNPPPPVMTTFMRRILASNRRGRCVLGERGDLFDERVEVDRLGHVILRALPQPPQAVGLLVFAGTEDDRNAPRRPFPRDGARGFSAVGSGPNYGHQDQIW